MVRNVTAGVCLDLKIILSFFWRKGHIGSNSSFCIISCKSVDGVRVAVRVYSSKGILDFYIITVFLASLELQSLALTCMHTKQTDTEIRWLTLRTTSASLALMSSSTALHYWAFQLER